MKRLAATALALTLLTACTGVRATVGSTPVPSPSSQRAHEERLRIRQPAHWSPTGKNWQVTLSWNVPVGVGVDHYQVFRNRVLQTDDLDRPVYVDRVAQPGMDYSYRVLGVGADSSPRVNAAADVSTHTPRLALARLDGQFNVRMHVDGYDNLQEAPKHFYGSFVFSPVCAHGACSSSWRDLNAKAKVRLRRRGRVYSGKGRGPYRVTDCRQAPIDEDLSVVIRVTGATAEDDAWYASKIEGTVDELAPASGCLTGHVHWSFSGS